ncbi:hypothetical protein EUTSA_v10005343mg [Eutrema salsugineum]|uniref:Uncharacterized protein n=1 Tax=Eutrema salsugineum TaxID=72664 RepID=V4KSU0_EUTSA|nr:hypothetical protein EUTSA_v10005343mg [Eutrema salsugineum]
MKKIMKLSAIKMVVTLLLLASGLAQARTLPLPPPPNLNFQTESKPFHKPPVFATEHIPPPPNQDAKKSVEQFPIPIICPPGLGHCIPPKLD